MEWNELLKYGLLFGIMFLIMRYGGCCGGHGHRKEDKEKKSDQAG